MESDPDEPPPRPLEYRRPGIERAPPGMPVAPQGMLGFVAWVGAVGLWLIICTVANGATAVAWPAAGAVLVGLAVLCVWMRIRMGWRGFLPGVLIGLFLTCLVPIGVVAVICGNWKF